MINAGPIALLNNRFRDSVGQQFAIFHHAPGCHRLDCSRIRTHQDRRIICEAEDAEVCCVYAPIGQCGIVISLD
jgi:hypothetical protein